MKHLKKLKDINNKIIFWNWLFIFYACIMFVGWVLNSLMTVLISGIWLIIANSQGTYYEKIHREETIRKSYWKKTPWGSKEVKK